MRKQLLPLVGVAFAGCGFEHGAMSGARDGAVGDTTVVVADAPPDGTGSGSGSGSGSNGTDDTDGDTVIDTIDNCPAVANTDQHDHDADGRGDVCDLCPHLASSSDPDGDGDGVGDACDPRPTTAGDTRLLFEGFYDATVFSTWTGVGTWSVANGKLTQSSTAGGGYYTQLVLSQTPARVYVVTDATMGAFGTAAMGQPPPTVAIGSGIVGMGQAYYCGVQLPQMNTRNLLEFDFWNGGAATPSTPWAGTFASGSQVRLTSQLSTSHMCAGQQGANAPQTLTAATPGTTSGAVRLNVNTAAASFDYVFVVAIGG